VIHAAAEQLPSLVFDRADSVVFCSVLHEVYSYTPPRFSLDSVKRVVQAAFAHFAFEGAPYGLISAQFALPFMPSGEFADVFTRLKAALAPGGIFAGQLFGVHDQWNTPGRPMTFLTRPELDFVHLCQ